MVKDYKLLLISPILDITFSKEYLQYKL